MALKVEKIKLDEFTEIQIASIVSTNSIGTIKGEILALGIASYFIIEKINIKFYHNSLEYCIFIVYKIA